MIAEMGNDKILYEGMLKLDFAHDVFDYNYEIVEYIEY